MSFSSGCEERLIAFDLGLWSWMCHLVGNAVFYYKVKNYVNSKNVTSNDDILILTLQPRIPHFLRSSDHIESALIYFYCICLTLIILISTNMKWKSLFPCFLFGLTFFCIIFTGVHMKTILSVIITFSHDLIKYVFLCNYNATAMPFPT